MDSNEYLRRVGEHIRKTRWAAELTQEGLAARGFSLRHIQLMERGTGNPTLTTLHDLADALNTTVAALVDVDPMATAKAKAALDGADASAPKRGRKPRSAKPGIGKVSPTSRTKSKIAKKKPGI